MRDRGVHGAGRGVHGAGPGYTVRAEGYTVCDRGVHAAGPRGTQCGTEGYTVTIRRLRRWRHRFLSALHLRHLRIDSRSISRRNACLKRRSSRSSERRERRAAGWFGRSPRIRTAVRCAGDHARRQLGRRRGSWPRWAPRLWRGMSMTRQFAAGVRGRVRRVLRHVLLEPFLAGRRSWRRRARWRRRRGTRASST